MTDRDLYELLREAHGCYQVEVINQKKLYSRYAEDFLNGHVHANGFTVKSKNRHRCNFGIAKALLQNRPDLVEQFFQQQTLDAGDIEHMLRLLNTTPPPHGREEPMDGATKVRTTPAHSTASTFCCHFSQATIDLITRCANEVQLFKEVVSSDDIAALFACRLEHPLTARNIRHLTLFFHYLAEHDLIVNTWQKVICTNRLILRPSGRSALTHRDLSSSLYQALEKPSNVHSTLIHDYVKRIAESVSKERKSIM